MKLDITDFVLRLTNGKCYCYDSHIHWIDLTNLQIKWSTTVKELSELESATRRHLPQLTPVTNF